MQTETAVRLPEQESKNSTDIHGCDRLVWVTGAPHSNPARIYNRALVQER